ncbi:hypothetical protein IAQ61_006620, partial [Plenodomus lingam]|uniref:uncharacterized protein n=1 Tax=Leptosphaeria maculans TaxID=5022 RepID=UPI00332A8C7C
RGLPISSRSAPTGDFHLDFLAAAVRPSVGARCSGAGALGCFLAKKEAPAHHREASNRRAFAPWQNHQPSAVLKIELRLSNRDCDMKQRHMRNLAHGIALPPSCPCIYVLDLEYINADLHQCPLVPSSTTTGNRFRMEMKPTPDSRPLEASVVDHNHN